MENPPCANCAMGIEMLSINGQQKFHSEIMTTVHGHCDSKSFDCSTVEQWLNSLANKWAFFKAWLANKWLGIFINWSNKGPNKGTLSWVLFGSIWCFFLCVLEKWSSNGCRARRFFLAIALNILAGRQVLPRQMPRFCGSHGYPFTGKRGGTLQRLYTVPTKLLRPWRPWYTVCIIFFRIKSVEEHMFVGRTMLHINPVGVKNVFQSILEVSESPKKWSLVCHSAEEEYIGQEKHQRQRENFNNSNKY